MYKMRLGWYAGVSRRLSITWELDLGFLDLGSWPVIITVN